MKRKNLVLCLALAMVLSAGAGSAVALRQAYYKTPIGVSAEEANSVDVTEKLKLAFDSEKLADGWPSLIFKLSFDEIASGLLPNGESDYWINDNPGKGSVDLMQYLLINGRSAREIVQDNADGKTSYIGTINDTLGGVFAPVAICVHDKNLEIFVQKQYLTDNGMEKPFSDLKLTLKSGVNWECEAGKLTTTQDVTYGFVDGNFTEITDTPPAEEQLNRITVDEKASIDIHGTDVNGAADLMLKFDGISNVSPTGETFWVNDHPYDFSRDVDLMEYILINGRSARDIVTENTGADAYVGVDFPMSFGGVFAPVAVCVESGGVIRIKVLHQYCNYTNLKITLKAGLQWRTFNASETEPTTVLVTEKDTTFYYKNGRMVKWDNEKDFVNLAENMGVNFATETADSFVYQIHFNKVFNEEATWIMDKATDNPAMYALQQAIAINGKTVQFINDNTDDSAYVYQTTIADWDSHKVPVRVLFDYYNGETLFTVHVHKDYVAANPIASISVLPFDWSVYSVKHSVKEEVEFRAVQEGDNEMFKQVCYVTFGGSEAISVLKGEKLTAEQIPADPTQEGTDTIEYVFDAWYYKDVNGMEMKFEPTYNTVDMNYALYAKFSEIPRRYTITYLDKDGNVWKTAQVSHGDTLTLSATPEIAHYTGAWVYQGEGTAPTEMPQGDITFKAEYKPTVYKVTFYYDENAMYELVSFDYTIEDKQIEEPQVAAKEGFTGVWQSYALNGGDVDVCPIYTAIPVETKKGGCSSVMSLGSCIGGLTILAAGAFTLKRKNRKK